MQFFKKSYPVHFAGDKRVKIKNRIALAMVVLGVIFIYFGVM